MADRESALGQVLAVGATMVGAVAVVSFVAYSTVIGPRLGFQPSMESYVFERDVVSGEMDSVPVGLIFSDDNVRRYWAGDGFTARFRVLHDPETGGGVSELECGLEGWMRFAETSNPARRELVAQREREFGQCVEAFGRPLSLPRAIEIGVDDTDGMDRERADFVRRALEDEDVSPARLFDLTRTDAVRLIFFRLSNIETYDQRVYPLAAGAPRDEIERAWAEGLDRWLLEDRAPRERTSIARGVFNALSRHGEMLRREVHIFSDGMENSPEVTSFYEIIDEGFDHEQLDRELMELLRCPASVPPVFELTWHFPPLELPFYYRIRDYWSHVLTEVCELPATTVLY